MTEVYGKLLKNPASCSKILNDRKYILNKVNYSGRLCSFGQVQVAQKP